MPHNTRNATSLAPEPPEPGGPNAAKPVMSAAIKALIHGHLRDASVFDYAANALEMEAAAQANSATSVVIPPRVQNYRQLAQREMTALIAVVRHHYEHSSLEQQCQWVEENIPLDDDDIYRLWTALLVG